MTTANKGPTYIAGDMNARFGKGRDQLEVETLGDNLQTQRIKSRLTPNSLKSNSNTPANNFKPKQDIHDPNLNATKPNMK